MKNKSVRSSKRNKKRVNKKHVNKKRVNLSNKNNIKRGKNTLQKKKKTIKKNRNKNLFKYGLPHELSSKYKIVNLINTKKFIQVGSGPNGDGNFNDWEGIRHLGQGGWANVYEVREKSDSGRDRESKAMKVVMIPLENGDDFVTTLKQKFDDEVEIMKKMHIEVYDKGEDKDDENNILRLYVVMSRFNGGNLKKQEKLR
jgi:hypothetical protein